MVERDPTYRIASSSLSASSIRQQFSTPLNIAMSRFGFEFLRTGGERLEVDGDQPALGLRHSGYLFMASAGGLETLRENHAVQRAEGADVALLSPGEITARFPWITTDGVAAASFGLSGEGWFDGPALLAAFRRKARALGVTYVAKEAVDLIRAGERVTGVRLADGVELACDVAVNAAGPWSARVAGWADIDHAGAPKRKRIMVFVVACRTPLPGCPMVIDPSGICMRPEGAFYLCCRSPGPDEPDPDEPPLEVDETMFHDMIWPVLAERIPALEELKLASSWAGYYEMNYLFGPQRHRRPTPGGAEPDPRHRLQRPRYPALPGHRARCCGADRRGWLTPAWTCRRWVVSGWSRAAVGGAGDLPIGRRRRLCCQSDRAGLAMQLATNRPATRCLLACALRDQRELIVPGISSADNPFPKRQRLPPETPSPTAPPTTAGFHPSR